MLRRLAVVFSTGLVLLLGFAGVANAESVALLDPRGDMWKTDGAMEDRPRPAPEQQRGDIRRATVNHAQHAVLLRTRFTELQRTGVFSFLAMRLRTNTGMVRFAYLGAGRMSDGRWRGDSHLERRGGRQVDCELTHDLDYAANVARLRVPRSCLGNPRWVQATVVSLHAEGGRRNFTMYFDNAHNDRLRPVAWTKRLRRG